MGCMIWFFSAASPAALCRSLLSLTTKEQSSTSLSASPTPPFPPKTQATAGSNEVTSWSPLFQSGQTKYPQPLLPGHISSPVISLIALNQTLTSFLYGGVQNCTQHWKWGCSSIKYSRKITYFDQLAVLSLPYPKMQFALFTAKVLLVHAKHSATCTPRSLPAVLPSSHSSPSLTCAWSCSTPNII